MSWKNLTRIFTPVLATALVATGCEDAISIEEHLEIGGFAVVAGETETYRYVATDNAPGELVLAPGAHDVAFVLLDADGQPVQESGDEDHEHELEITIADEMVLTWAPEEHTHATEHVEFHGVLTGVETGNTTMDVCIPHGSHCDFEVVNVPVQVSP